MTLPLGIPLAYPSLWQPRDSPGSYEFPRCPQPPQCHLLTKVSSSHSVFNLALTISLRTWLLFLHKMPWPYEDARTIRVPVLFTMSDMSQIERKLGSFSQDPFYFTKELKSLTIIFYLTRHDIHVYHVLHPWGKKPVSDLCLRIRLMKSILIPMTMLWWRYRKFQVPTLDWIIKETLVELIRTTG